MTRLRRLRRNEVVRDLVAETAISPKDLVMPYFVIEGKMGCLPIKSMPGIKRLSIDNLIKDVKEAQGLGIKAVLVFGISHRKDDEGSDAYNEDGIVQKAVRAIAKNVKDMAVITDVCLCGYTSHGHCGIVEESIDNDKTIEILAKIALSHAEAGADFVAPSAMMDGQVGAIREALDEKGYKDTGILAYSAKYASSFYGPFREALDSSPQFGDRKTYQMDYRNSDEALREIKEDIDEGADIIMVKPALAYLDIIYRAKEKFNVPIAAYNVSGEYAMVKAYCRTTNDESFGRAQDSSRAKSRDERRTTEEERRLIMEILTAIKRAGADLIITYHAKEVARWLRR